MSARHGVMLAVLLFAITPTVRVKGAAASTADSLRLAQALHARGDSLRQIAQYGPAAERLSEARDIYLRVLGPDSAMTASARFSLGLALQNLEDFPGARQEFEASLAATRLANPSDRTTLVTTELALGSLLVSMRDVAGARRYYELALGRLEAAGDTTKASYGLACQRFGIMLRGIGSYDSALVFANRALALRTRLLGTNSTSTASSLALVGAINADMGHFETASQMLESSYQTCLSLKGPNDLNTLARVINLGNLARAANNNVAAESLFTRLVEGRTLTFGRRTETVAEALFDLAQANQVLGHDSLAVVNGLEATAIRRDLWRASLPFMEESAGFRLTNKWWVGYEVATDVAGTGNVSPNLIARTWETVIQMRTLVMDEISRVRRAQRDSLSPDDRASWAEWIETRRQLSRSIVSGAAHDSLAAAADSMERAIAIKRRRPGQVTSAADPSFEDIRRALPSDCALVGYLRYSRINRATQLARWQNDIVFNYAAFVVRSDGSPPVVVPLGSATMIDSLTGRWSAATSPRSGEAGDGYWIAGTNLRRAVWDPVAKKLPGVRRVFVVPDGTLGRIAWAALPTGRGKFLIDADLDLSRLFSERDLIRSGVEAHAEEAGLLAIGNVDYDARSVPSRPAGQLEATRGASDSCAWLSERRFQPLPATRQELESVRAAWEGGRGSIDVVTGRAATASRFVADAPKHRTLHLATHGFYLKDQCGPDVLDLGASLRFPLDRCGLVFAGANEHSSSPVSDDGLVTGNEIAGLDLQGVNWVVLSACESGAGDVGRTEGIFGLERAFRMAGSKAVIMAPWPVQDDVARAWMSELYRGRFSQGRPTAEAARDASRSVLAALRRSGHEPLPTLWCPFVVSGLAD